MQTHQDTTTHADTLARAVLLFHAPGAWTPDRQRVWVSLTDTHRATTKVLCDLARKALDAGA